MFVTPPMMDAVNRRFHGEVVRCLMTERTDPEELNFSRNSAPQDLLAYSLTKVRRQLIGHGIALPREYKPEANDMLAQLAEGGGFTKNFLNPNPAAMALVTSQRDLVLAATWADAPAFICVYADPFNSDIRVIAAGSGIWHVLPQGTIRQTVELIRKEVERLGGDFDAQNLWVTTSPGARADGDWPFRLDAKGEGILSEGDTKNFVSRFVRPLDDPTPEPWRGDKPLRDRVLDLSGLVAGLWETHGLVQQGGDNPDGQLYFDERPNGRLGFANKRLADATSQVSSSEVIAISLV